MQPNQQNVNGTLAAQFDQFYSKFHDKIVVSEPSNDISSAATAGSKQNILVIKMLWECLTLANIMTFHTFSLSDNSDVRIIERICQCYKLQIKF